MLVPISSILGVGQTIGGRTHWGPRSTMHCDGGLLPASHSSCWRSVG